MICYICSKPASFRCPACKRYVCSSHTEEPPNTLYCADDPTQFYVGGSVLLFSEEGHLVCSNCAEKGRKDTRSQIEEAKKSMSDQGKCEVGGHIVDCSTRRSYCNVCYKHFCPKHGQIVFYRTINFSVEIWCRCVNHLKFPDILGKHYLKKRPLFCGKPDKEETLDEFREDGYFRPFRPLDEILKELE